ncbi:MAG TPA: SPOR domain-containing protein [Rugosibacter sp.]
MKNNTNNIHNTSAKKSGGSTLTGVFIGLVIGLVMAFILVWLFNHMPLPFRHQETSAPEADSVPSQSDISLPGKPGDKPREKQKLEFYDMLEGKPADNATSGNVPSPVTKEPSGTPASTEASGEPKSVDVFFLQVGAFQNMRDVDNLKAKLALQGLDSNVQEITIANKGVMQRVRVGPFHSLAEMNRARTALVQSGIQTTVVKQPAAQ